MKANKYNDALEELIEVEELEKTLYGETSTQLAKTYKVIGTLYIISNKPGEARDYLMRAHNIFESKGQVKLLKEVKNKLRMLNSSMRLAAQAAIAEQKKGFDEGGDTANESGNDGTDNEGTKRSKPLGKKKLGKKFVGMGKIGSAGASKGKKKPFGAAQAKGAVHNNFMEDGRGEDENSELREEKSGDEDNE